MPLGKHFNYAFSPRIRRSRTTEFRTCVDILNFFRSRHRSMGREKKNTETFPSPEIFLEFNLELEISHELRVFHSPVFSTGESEKSYTFEISRLGSRRWQIFRTQSRQFNVSMETGSRGPVLGGERRFLDKSIRS